MPVGASMQAGLAALLAGVVVSSASHAAMRLDRTRLIVNEAHGRAVIQAHSSDSQPLLLQAWVDDGNQPGSHTPPTDASSPMPFITDPPVLRLDAGKSRAIQVLLTAAPETLPADRETLYWLNVLEVPTQGHTAPATSRLHISVQSRLKLFYRPQALARYDAAMLAPADRLRFALERDDAGQAWLAIHNPAPIHQTLATLALHRPGAAPMTLDAPMLAPFETQRLALPQPFSLNPPSGARLAFATVNDDGNLIEDEQTL